ncbi:MAG: homocysteine S-methyltransferase family protein [Planctomycetota bacterium]
MAIAVDELRHRLTGGALVLDGATGTELERRGVGSAAPLWSAAALRQAPEVVAAIHRDYVAAGADLLVANTFRTNPRTLKRAGWGADGGDLNRLAVELARQAAAGADRQVLVAASVAPAEDCYEPQRAPDDATLRAEHGELMDWLAVAGPDLIWIETMNTVREARVAAEAAASRGLPLAVSFVVQEGGDLLSGEPLEAAVAEVEPFDPIVVGLNCIPPRGLSVLLPRLRRATGRPVAAYAHINNAVPIRSWSYGQAVPPAEYGRYVRQWLELGAAVAGGCCGTTPGHIEAVRAVVDEFVARV